jgi:hypothetical protein
VSKKLYIGVSSFLGALLCVFIETGTKGDCGTLGIIKLNLASFLGTNNMFAMAILTIFILLLVGTALPFILKADSYKMAFLNGATVLAFGMTMVPFSESPNFKHLGNSVEVIIQVTTSDEREVLEIIAKLWDKDKKEIVARSKFDSNNFTIIQDGGEYRLIIEASGYRIETKDITLIEGQSPVRINFILRPSWIPLKLQRVFK